MVEQIATTTLHPSLGNSILLGASERGSFGRNADRLHHGCDLGPELRVTVEDQIFVRESKGKNFPQLLYDPAACLVVSHIGMQDSPTVFAGEEEAVEDSKCKGVACEKVHRCNDFAVVLEKSLLPISVLRISRCPLNPTRNGALRDVEPKHL
jgi:hypothetical protein